MSGGPQKMEIALFIVLWVIIACPVELNGRVIKHSDILYLVQHLFQGTQQPFISRKLW